MSLQTEQHDEGLRRVYPDGVLVLQWGPSGALSSAAEAGQHEDVDRQAPRWLSKLQQAEVGLAVHLGCTLIAASKEV